MGFGCPSRILILPPQCCLLKWKRKPLHVWEEPGHLGKWPGHLFIVRRNLTPYTWGWCTVWLNGIRIQYIVGSVLCMRQRAIMEPTVSSTPHSEHGIRCQSLTWYESPTPVHFNAMASSDLPARNAPGWNIIVRDLATLAARPYLLKRPTRTFIA